jgi:phosphoribosylformylglycinamidine cyclo-ligase
VGVVERSRILDGRTIEAGDVLVGLPSSGLHSNGYSLVRKVVFDQAKLNVSDFIPELGRTLGEELLVPTRIYVQTIHGLVARYKVKKPIKGIANITGGGFDENVPRILPPGVSAVIRRKAWKLPAVFGFIQKTGGVEIDEMYRTFNMGMGMVLVVSRHFVDAVLKHLEELGEAPVVIGHVAKGPKKVVWK